MSFRPHPKRARVDPASPVAWATCDGCGFITNINKLQWQYEWTGPQLTNRRFLRCQVCINKPNETLRTIVLPADPDPVLNARPEGYAIDEQVTPTNPGFLVSGDRHALRVILRAPGVRGGPRVINGTPPLQTSF